MIEALDRSEWERYLYGNVKQVDVCGYYKEALIRKDSDRDTWEHTVEAHFKSENSSCYDQLCYSGKWINAWESITKQVVEAMDAIDAAVTRKATPPISYFSDMIIDLHHIYWHPAVRAVFEDKSIVIDCNLRIIKDSTPVYFENFKNFHYNYPIPEKKVQLLRKWISAHKNEIIENHRICAKGGINVRPIAPL